MPAPPASASAPSPAPPQAERPLGPGEAARATLGPRAARNWLAGVDPKVVARHFASVRRLEAQSVRLGPARRAVLAYREPGALKPLLLVRGAHGELLWQHDRPTGGLLRPVTELALASGPEGGVVLFSYDAPTQLVAARMWGASGALLADYEALRIAACDALSALYWHGRGWVVGCSTRDGARLSLLTEAGALGWNGLTGVALATNWRAAAPLSLVADTDHTVMAWHVGYLEARPTSRSADHLFVSRYDARGKALWPGPLDAGRLPARVRDTATRVVLQRLTPGTVRATIASGSRFSVVVSSEGRVLKP